MDAGLEDVIAARTVLSHVYGEEGRLVVRGHELEDLVAAFGFEETAALLWDGLADPAAPADALPHLLGEARREAFRLVPGLLEAAAGLTPVEALRAGLALLPDAGALPAHVRVTAAAAVFAAAIARRDAGLPPVVPDPGQRHAADLLRMLHGDEPEEAHVRALETYLVTVADHGLNASTFAARVVASTRAGIISAAVAGLCALKGPLHGGAPGPVLDMLDAIGAEARIEPWIEARVAAKERLMGFGHRVYRARDPRADVLKAAVLALRGGANRVAFAERVEQAALAALARHHPGRRLDTNVEFYTALLLEAVGIPRPLFTPVFAIGRVLGWTAHAYEQLATGRLVRPQSVYAGPQPQRGRAAE